MAVFRAFKPEAMNKIAKSMGYTGNMAQFQDFIEQDPARKARMQQFTNAAVQMAKGGVVKMQTGGIMQAPGTVQQLHLAHVVVCSLNLAILHKHRTQCRCLAQWAVKAMFPPWWCAASCS